MAADVLMGNDAECGRWIRAHREPVPEGDGQRGRRVNTRRTGAGARPPRRVA